MRRTGAFNAWLGLTGVLGAVALARSDGPASQPSAAKATTSEAKSVYDFSVKDIDGKDVSLARYKGEVVMIVNIASQCGLTDNHYKKLEPLYQKYKEKGFKIVAFPANNFGQQEPGTEKEIKEFCAKYRVTFDLFSKLSVKGEDQAPLYQYLTKHPDPAVAGDVKWNFQKYLVDRKGEVIAMFSPRIEPDAPEVVEKIEKALAAPAK